MRMEENALVEHREGHLQAQLSPSLFGLLLVHMQTILPCEIVGSKFVCTGMRVAPLADKTMPV